MAEILWRGMTAFVHCEFGPVDLVETHTAVYAVPACEHISFLHKSAIMAFSKDGGMIDPLQGGMMDPGILYEGAISEILESIDDIPEV
jgi:hypothetical protein